MKAIPFTKKHEDMLISNTKKLEEHDKRFDQVDARFDQVDARFDKIDGRMDGFHSRMDGFEQRMDRFEKKLNDHSEQLHRMGILDEERDHKIDAILEVVTHINKRFIQQDEMQVTIDNHENRISAIEGHIKVES